jgi:hypothetical protein
MNHFPFVLLGIAGTLILADTWLTLHGLGTNKGVTVSESNRLMRWFVQKPWRAYAIDAVALVVLYLAVWVLADIHWAIGSGFCIPIIAQRIAVVIRNYKINVKVW